MLIFIIFILYLSVFRSSAIRSYSFTVNISAQYSFGGLLPLLHYTITQYIFAELFYIIIPSVLSLHNISILSVYSYIAHIPGIYIYYISYPRYIITPYCLYLLYCLKYLVCCYYNCYIYYLFYYYSVILIYYRYSHG